MEVRGAATCPGTQVNLEAREGKEATSTRRLLRGPGHLDLRFLAPEGEEEEEPGPLEALPGEGSGWSRASPRWRGRAGEVVSPLPLQPGVGP